MGRFIPLDSKPKIIILVAIVASCLLIILAAVCGYLGGKSAGGSSKPGPGSLGSQCGISPDELGGSAKSFYKRLYSKYTDDVCIPEPSGCNTLALPRHYVAYHLNGRSIVIDGQGTDQAWTQVPWSETFIDPRGELYPKPRFDTKFKVRWDDSKLYMLLYVQDTDLWGTLTQQDSSVDNDNEVEVLMDVDGSLWYYKQVQVNVLSSWRDIVWAASPFDRDVNITAGIHAWSAGIEKAVYAAGTINNPQDRDHFWSVEMSITFDSLAQYSARTQIRPSANEAWFMQFGRAQYDLNVVNNKYVPTTSHPKYWWSWQSCGAVNFHLQDRWGLIMFKKDVTDTSVSFPKWHIYKALFDVFNGMKKYMGVNGKYSDSLYDLEVPVYLLSGECVKIPTISLSDDELSFQVTVISNDPTERPGHIRQDRYVWFV